MLLKDAIEEQNIGSGKAAQLTYSFFVDLHKEHERILELLESKIKETEAVAEAIFQGREKKEDAVPLKAKIFEICKMIYD